MAEVMGAAMGEGTAAAETAAAMEGAVVTVVVTVEAEETRALGQKGIRALVIRVPVPRETQGERLVRLEGQTPAARRVLAMLAAEIRAGRLEIRQAANPGQVAAPAEAHKAPAET